MSWPNVTPLVTSSNDTITAATCTGQSGALNNHYLLYSLDGASWYHTGRYIRQNGGTVNFFSNIVDPNNNAPNTPISFSSAANPIIAYGAYRFRVRSSGTTAITPAPTLGAADNNGGPVYSLVRTNISITLARPIISSTNIVYNTMTVRITSNIKNASFFKAYSNVTYLGEGTSFSNIRIPLSSGITYSGISIIASYVTGSNTNQYDSINSLSFTPAGGLTPVTPANATAALGTLTPNDALGYYITNTGSNAADVCVDTRGALKTYTGDKVSARNFYISTLAKKANALVVTLPTSNVASLNNSFVSGSLPVDKQVDVFLTDITASSVDITSLNTDGTKTAVFELPMNTGVTVNDNGSNVGNLYYKSSDSNVYPTSDGTGSAISINNMMTYGQLNLTVSAFGSLGGSGSTVPDAPTDATATAGNAQATVSWTAPASNGAPITSYTVTSSPGGFTATTEDGNTTTATVTGLTNGIAYTFTVTATNAAGTSAASSASNSVTPSAPAPSVPDAPTGATATAGNAQATVSWTAPANDGGAAISSYTVTSNPGGFTATTSDGNTTTATVTGLTNGIAYTFTVTATNAAGTSDASLASNSVTPGDLWTNVVPTITPNGDSITEAMCTGQSGASNYHYLLYSLDDSTWYHTGRSVQQNGGIVDFFASNSSPIIFSGSNNPIAKYGLYKFRVRSSGTTPISPSPSFGTVDNNAGPSYSDSSPNINIRFAQPVVSFYNNSYNTMNIAIASIIPDASSFNIWGTRNSIFGYLGNSPMGSEIRINLSSGTYTKFDVYASDNSGNPFSQYNSIPAVINTNITTPVTPVNAATALATLTPNEALGYYITNTGSNAADVCVDTRNALKLYTGDKVSARNFYISTLAKKANASMITLPTSNVASLNTSFVSGSLPTDKPVDMFLTDITAASVDITSLNTDGTKNAVFELPMNTGVTVKDNGSNVGNLYMQYFKGAIDPTFTSGANANVANTAVSDIAVQSDGNIVIVGNFTSYSGQSRNKIARLYSDGSLDESFVVGTGIGNVFVASVAIQTIQNNIKILVGGFFTTYNGESRNNIVRLNADGSLDNTFNVDGTGPSALVNAITIQSDGKILIGGGFTTYNGTARNRIARLNADGSLDTSFDSGTGIVSAVQTIAIQSNGRILIGTTSGIVRLNADGSLDNTFNVDGTGPNGAVSAIAIQSDEKILIGGSFTTYNGQSRNYIARLNTNGTLDTSFDIGTGANLPVQTIAIQRDGNILIGGQFTTYNGQSQNYIASLNAYGSLDNTFNAGTGTNNGIRSIAIQSDGNMLIGGPFTSYNGVSRNYIARLNSNSIKIYPTSDGTGSAISINDVMTYGQLNLTVSAFGSLGGSGSLSGGGGGDPYVTTMNRASYKLPTMNAPIRFYQGMVDGELLTVNASLKTIPKSDMMDAEIRDYFRLSKDLNLTAKQRSFLEHSMFKDETLCFFERVYIKHGENTMTMRIFDSKFEVESYTGHIPATLVDDKDSLRRSTGIYGSYAGKTLKLRCGSASVLVSVYNAPIVRNGINVMATLTKESNGVLVNVLSSKDMKLDRLEDTAAVPQRDSPVCTITETFTDADGMRSRKIAVAK